MSSNFTVTYLVEAVKSRGMFPNNQKLFTPEKILNFANDEMQQTVVPMIMSVREDYFLKDVNLTPTGSIPKIIEIPPDAIGMKCKSVGIYNNEEKFVNLPRLEIEEVDQYTRYGFVLQGNKIKIYSDNTQFKVYYFKRPLELTNQFATITDIDTVTNEVTVDVPLDAFQVGVEINSIESFQPFSSYNFTITNVATNVYTLDSVEGINVGDYLCLKGFSCVAQLPVEAQKVLIQATVVKCLESIGDREGMAAAESKLDQNIKSMYKMITPRVDGSPKKIVDTGISRWTGNFRRWRY